MNVMKKSTSGDRIPEIGMTNRGKQTFVMIPALLTMFMVERVRSLLPHNHEVGIGKECGTFLPSELRLQKTDVRFHIRPVHYSYTTYEKFKKIPRHGHFF